MLVIMENVRSHCLATITAFTWSPLNINTLLLFKTIVLLFLFCYVQLEKDASYCKNCVPSDWVLKHEAGLCTKTH